MTRSRRQAFTLFELLLVLAVMGAMGAMVLPFALKSLQSQTLSAVANDLASEMLDLRILALKTGEAQVMHIFPASSVYAVGKLNSEAAKRKKSELRFREIKISNVGNTFSFSCKSYRFTCRAFAGQDRPRHLQRHKMEPNHHRTTPY